MHIKSLIIALLSTTKSSIASGTWDYDHIAEWAAEFPMCAAADESPINIYSPNAIDDDTICTSTFDWDVDYTQHKFQIQNNGHSVVLKAVEISDFDGLSINDIVGRRRRLTDLIHTGEDEEDTTTIDSDYINYLNGNDDTIATFPNYFLPETSDHSPKFCLDSFHFHWGKTDEYGSEHTFDGKHYPLEAHFVHYSCDHSGLVKALDEYPEKEIVEEGVSNGDDVHVLGVVGIFFDVVEDRTNPAFDSIFTDATAEQIKYPDHGDGTQTSEIIDGLDLSELIPSDISSAGYYAYEGSLTTPPCTDIVRWYVMNAHGYIGKSQLEKFRALMATTNHTVAPNYRDIQSNANNVYACIEDSQRTDISNNEDVEISNNDSESGLEAFWNKNALAIYAIIGGFLVLAFIIGLVIICNNVRKNSNGDRQRVPNDEIDGIADDNQLEIEVEDDNQQLIQ